MFTDADAAALYDELNPWDVERFPGDAYYLDMVMVADSVLDVGCGTGQMLHQAREKGHRGRFVGIDPDQAALDRARRRADIEWVHGRAVDVRPGGEFELATMVSCAFQCLVDDDELRESLHAIRDALKAGGRFAFETRHPQARAWDDWNPSNPTEVNGLRVEHNVEKVEGDVVTVTETTSENGDVLRVDRTSLRFLDVPELNGFLEEAGFVVEAQYGDWQRGPVTPKSRLIATIARR